jgi:hypothetical protein
MAGMINQIRRKELQFCFLLFIKELIQLNWYNPDIFTREEKSMDIHIPADTILKKHIALPQDHGSWVFLLSPLLIGLFASGGWGVASFYLIVACMAAFLARQPLTVVIKVYSRRRPQRDLPAAWLWTAVYGLAGLAGLAGLISMGHIYLVYLALPGLVVFGLHLYLVSRRAERRQMGIELIASGVLALAAPAAYWVGVGRPGPEGWLLWILVWMQSAASIVYAYLRLEQRVLEKMPLFAMRLKMGKQALIFTTLNLLFVTILSIRSLLPSFLFLPFALQWVETLYGTLNPAVGYKPTRIGMRQLIVSSLFTLLFILAWSML